MSQISNKLANIIKSNFHRKFCHEPGESVSSRSSRGVGDSARTIEGRRITNIATGTFTLLISILAIFCTPFSFNSYVRADDDSGHVGHNIDSPDEISTASTITVSITGSPTLNLKTTTDGVFGDSGNATITVTTNHAAGYALTLSASGKNNPTSLDTNGGATSGGTVGFVSLGTKKDNQDVCPSGINATAFNTTDCNGYWGYKPSKYNSVDNTSTNYYYASPTTSGDTLDTTSNASDGSYTVSIGARADTNTAIAEYSNTFVFAVTGNPTPYAITYNANAGTDTVTNMPTNHTTSDTGASGETVTLDATVPVREGYTFKGWCSTTTSDDSCSGTTYNPDGDGTNLSLTINQQSATNSYTLYAMWASSGGSSTCATPVPGVASMQAFASLTSAEKTTVMNNMTQDAEYGIKDTRDGKTYCVAKLQDGHIWMTQNLDYNITTDGLTSDTSDLTVYNSGAYTAANGYSQTNGITKWTPARDTINAVTDASTAGSIKDWSSQNAQPYSVDPGDWYWKGKTFYASNNCYVSNNNQTCNYITKAVATYSTYFTTDVDDSGVNGSHGHVGNYYNWSAAVASNSTSSYSSNTSTNIANNPQNSICPAGWRLPTAYGTTTSNANTTNDTKNEFYTLNRLYNSSSTSTSQKLEASPLFFVRAGYVSGGSLNYAGRYANYWSSTVNSGTFAYYLSFDSASVSPANYNLRYNGYSVRCLVR